MAMKYYLAIDIGASSGRHMLGHIGEDGLVLEEIYRFPNGMIEKDGHLVWNHEELLKQIITGMQLVGKRGITPVSVGLDTWGVDFALLDIEGNLLGDIYGYRDERTKEMEKEVSKYITEEKLYTRTGIQKQSYNTIYQLMAVKKHFPKLLDEAETLLMVPDYLNYRLCGVGKNEYSEASTTGLLNPVTKTWDTELIQMLGLPTGIFKEVVMSGTKIGTLLPEIAAQVGFSCDIIAPCTHDTGSAILAVPYASANAAFISSGTWSLMGIELPVGETGQKSRDAGLTNEGGYAGKTTLVKNIMGLWMIQSVKKEFDYKYDFGQLCEMAEQSSIPSLVDCQLDRFLAPKSMRWELQTACEESGQRVPQTAGDFARVVYQSLAECYRKTLQEISEITGKKIDTIHIVGGGSKAEYLNQLTEEKTGCKVIAGPGEATAIGNLLAQMISEKEFTSVEEARNLLLKMCKVAKKNKEN